MIFPSYIFMLALLPIVLVFWYGLKSIQVKLILLSLASYVFYGWWDYRFTFLMLASTTLDYVCGQNIYKHTDPKGKKRWLYFSIVGNLLALGFFKYYNFFIDSFIDVLSIMGWSVSIPTLKVILPIGISFYTFQSMSYSIDIYRGICRPSNNYFFFTAYVTMFPQLVAGPIVRYSSIEQQLNNLPSKKIQSLEISQGIWFFCLGLFKKIMIADRLAPFAEFLFDGTGETQLFASWIGTLCYTFQLYFDFSGYSDMARGLGFMLGFEFPINFKSPYKSASISEFWNRWHITLSNWLRDYLFIPLGGSRGTLWKTLRNLGITMFLGGLWHGAAWTFVLWGIYHGTLLCINAVWRKLKLLELPKTLAVFITFIAVVFGWVIFRAPTMERALEIYSGMLGMNGIEGFTYDKWFGISLPGFFEQLFYLRSKFVGLARMMNLPIAALIVFLLPNTDEFKKSINPLFAIVLAVLVLGTILKFAQATPFLYFQF